MFGDREIATGAVNDGVESRSTTKLLSSIELSDQVRPIAVVDWAVATRAVGAAGPTPPDVVATFFWVDGSGAIAETVQSVPVQNGVALYSGDPLPHGARWAITVHDPAGLPFFRSGPLAKLPGPASSIALISRISAFRASRGGAFGINSPDGMPQFVKQRLDLLPPALRVDSVQFTADSAGHEVVVVEGRVRFFFAFWQRFRRSLPLTLRPATEPGKPEDIIIVEPELSNLCAIVGKGQHFPRVMLAQKHALHETDCDRTELDIARPDATINIDANSSMVLGLVELGELPFSIQVLHPAVVAK